jgi:hypothetical protein
MNRRSLFSKLAALFVIFLAGCEDDKMYWSERHEPTTDVERQAVAEQVQKIMAATPRTLSGSDQDWDDAIDAATRSAKATCCRTTLWEHVGFGNWTGKWRYADTVNTQPPAVSPAPSPVAPDQDR